MTSIHKSKPLGQSVDCDVCVAKAGQPCYIQTSASEHARTGYVYTPGDAWLGAERFHVGIRLRANTSLNRELAQGTNEKPGGNGTSE